MNQNDVAKINSVNLSTFISLQRIGLAGKYQGINAVLARELCRKWVESCKDKVSAWNDEKSIHGLEQATWPGRSQTFKQGEITWFFDGAHTSESIDLCVDWFKSAAQSSKKR